MNFISDILYWISTGLLVPVIVLLIILFCRAILLAGSFYGQYLSIRKTETLLRNELSKLTPDTVEELSSKLPENSRSLVITYMRQVLTPVILRHRYNVYWLILKSQRTKT